MQQHGSLTTTTHPTRLRANQVGTAEYSLTPARGAQHRVCQRRFVLPFLVAFMTLATLPAAYAQMMQFKSGKGSLILQNADSFYRDTDRKLMVLKGHVQIVYDEQHLSADHVTIYEATQELEAEGNVVLNTLTAYAEGDRARFNYQTGQGVIYDGFVRTGQVVFEGRLVRKIGPEEFEAEHAYYTSCTTCPPAWSFTGSRIRASVGGYAYIRNSVLEISHFPVFWLPYIIVPLKSDRQSGFLIPTFDMSAKHGTALGESFFWAMSQSQDATFTLKNYSYRGLKGRANYRYVLTDTSLGEANVGLIQDRLFAGSEEFRKYRQDTKFNRWYLNFQNVYEMPNGYVQRAKINLISDLRYPGDFPDETPGFGDPAVENRVSLSRNFEHFHTSIDTSLYTNLLKENPIADNADAVHRFPELRLSSIERQIGETGIRFRLDTNYVNYSREDFAYDDIVLKGELYYDGVPDPVTKQLIKTCQSDYCIDTSRGRNGLSAGQGRFDPKRDVIRAGQRFDINPEITRPILIGNWLDILPVLSFRHTQYAFDVTPDASTPYDTTPFRQYIQSRLTARTSVHKIYGAKGDPKETRYKHDIQPQVEVSLLPWAYQPEHDFFGSTDNIPTYSEGSRLADGDLRGERGIQFDSFDRVPKRNIITYSLTNKLIRRAWAGEAPDYKQIVTFRLEQSYDIDQSKNFRPNHQERPYQPSGRWTEINGLLDIRLGRVETSLLASYYPYHNVSSSSSRVRVKNDRGYFIELRAEQRFPIANGTRRDYLGETTTTTENIGLGAGFQIAWVQVEGSIENQPLAHEWIPPEVKAKSWALDLQLRPPGDCWNMRAQVTQVIGELHPHFKFNFDFFFGGDVL